MQGLKVSSAGRRTRAGPLCLAAPCSDRVLRKVLDRFLEKSDLGALAAGDPIELVQRYRDPRDQEVAGLLVAALAYGRVASIKAKASQALARLGDHPASAIDDPTRLRALSGFVHRFQRGEDLPRFLAAIASARRSHGSLAGAFAAQLRDGEPDYAGAADRFTCLLRALAGEQTYGLRFLLPRVQAPGGAAKRLCLYLRWMIRPASVVDLGAWQALVPGVFDPARLIIPLDTHIERIGRYIGLTDRRTAGFRTAQDITDTLRRLRPDDPLAYDLVLCHLGISGRCPTRRDPVLCRGCPIRAVCRLGKKPAEWPA